LKTCAAFYHHTNLRAGNRIFPCCRFKSPIGNFNGNVSTILTSSAYENLRNTDVSELSGCAKCMHEESNGKESLRQWFNKSYDTDSIGLEYLEIGFDNICNAACDGCWSEFSHTWSKIEKPNASSKSHIISSTEILDIPDTVKEILFLGGEPLMTNRHKRMLQMVKDLSIMTITYNTNGSFLLDDATVKILNKCKTVKFILSIDGYGELNEKVRKNCTWESVLKFINQIQSTDFDLEIHTVVHKNNWHGLQDLQEFISANNLNWRTNILTYPNHLDIANCDNKEKILDYIKNLNIPNKEYVINHIKESLIENINT
jgi:sulfatase maturation enzyme AslB (radical SAM superfamily)